MARRKEASDILRFQLSLGGREWGEKAERSQDNLVDSTRTTSNSEVSPRADV